MSKKKAAADVTEHLPHVGGLRVTQRVRWSTLVVLLCACSTSAPLEVEQSSDEPHSTSLVASFPIRTLPDSGRLAVFARAFGKYTEVFGVVIVATRDVPNVKVQHAAQLMAQYLDNDEDGQVDDPRAHAALTGHGAFLVMAQSERDFEGLRLDFHDLERAGFEIGQDLYGEETLPGGPPHVQRRGRFDAALEEVLHLVSWGWVLAYPEHFGLEPGSRLTDAMDAARAGRHKRVPRRYPDQAWYHYDDRTCDYECMAMEYLYWALTTRLDGQSYPGRAEEIEEEWELTTPDALRAGDVLVTALFDGPPGPLPSVLPDGSYTGPRR